MSGGSGLLSEDQLDYYRAYGHNVAGMQAGQIIGDLLGHITVLVGRCDAATTLADADIVTSNCGLHDNDAWVQALHVREAARDAYRAYLEQWS